MQRNKVITFIFILGLLLIFLFVYFFLIRQPKTNNEIQDTGGINFFQDLINFGRKNTPNNNEEEEDKTGFFDFLKGDDEEEIVDVKKLSIRKISSIPVSGYGLYLKEIFEYVPPPIINEANAIETNTKPEAPKTEFVTSLKYVEKRTGNIYQNFLNEENERRFSETIIPNIEEAYFLNNTNTILMRFLRDDSKTIASFLGNTREEILGQDFSSLERINGSFLPENILSVTISPDNKNLFYITKTNNGVSGSIVTNSGLAKAQIFGSAFSEWLVEWPNENLITLTTKPSGLVPGYVYALNPQNRDFYKILGGINGLTTLTSKDGKNILFGNENLSLRVFNTETKSTTTLNTSTLPEKCVWSNDNENVYCLVPKSPIRGIVYPDVWYQGEISFNDDLWKINTKNKTKTKILEIINEENQEEIDGIRISLDKEENNLFFINKKDFYLWGVKLK